LHFNHAKPRLQQQADNLAPAEQVHREAPHALMRRHVEIAKRAATGQRLPDVVPQQSPSSDGAKVKPAVVDVQHEDAAGTQRAMNLLQHARRCSAYAIMPSVLNKHAAASNAPAAKQLSSTTLAWTRSMRVRRGSFLPGDA
jgi:hypothetical protein